MIAGWAIGMQVDGLKKADEEDDSDYTETL